MKAFFKFFSVAYIVIFDTGVLVANNMSLDIKMLGLGFIITCLCGIFLAYDYSKIDYK